MKKGKTKHFYIIVTNVVSSYVSHDVGKYNCHIPGREIYSPRLTDPQREHNAMEGFLWIRESGNQFLVAFS